jgi:hypothetical protein
MTMFHFNTDIAASMMTQWVAAAVGQGIKQWHR